MKWRTHRTSLVGLLALVFAAACSSGGAAESESSGESIVGGQAASRYEEAALIDIEKGGVVRGACSGSVIAPRVVLTAGHCVVGGTGWQVTTPFASNQKVRSLKAMTYDYDETRELVNPNEHDVGLIVLPTPINLAKYPKLARTPVTSADALVNVGRIKDGALSTTALFASAPVRVVPATNYGFPYAYIATEVIQPGDSGGPDFLAGSDPHVIAAVNSGAGQGTEILARVDLVVTWIDGIVAGNGGYGTSDGGAPDGGTSDAGTDGGDAGKPTDGGTDAARDGATEAGATDAGSSDASAPHDSGATTSGDDAGSHSPSTGSSGTTSGGSTKSGGEDPDEIPRRNPTIPPGQNSGCSASPEGATDVAPFALGLGLLLAIHALRRRAQRRP